MKVTFKCYIETPTEQITDEYTLDDEETLVWQAMSEEDREKWKGSWADTAFLNACSYGTGVEVEP